MSKRLSEDFCERKIYVSRKLIGRNITPVSEPTETTEMEPTAMSPAIAVFAQVPQAARPAIPPGTDIEALLLRMRAGDREAAAMFLKRYESRIRRRVHGKLGTSIRRLYDSLEIMSTVGRRLDRYVLSGRVRADDEKQVLKLLFKIADRAMIDKARVFKRLQTIEGEDGEFAHQMGARLHQADQDDGVELEIDNCLRALPDQKDRHILSLWLTGESHGGIARLVELAPTAVRKRWEGIKEQLKVRFEIAGV